MAGATDPFFIVRDEVKESIEEAQAKLNRFRRTKATKQKEDVQRECDSILWQLDELSRAIDAADADKQRFQLSDAELRNRRQWVHEQREHVQAMLHELPDDAAKHSTNQASSESQYMPASSSADGSHTAAAMAEQSNQRFVASKKEEQQRLVQQQDEELEQLSQGVVRLGEVGRTIGEELNTQNQMLSSVEEQADTLGGRLRAAERKMQQVMKKAGMCGQIGTIVCLAITLVLLIVIAASTS